MPHVRLQPDKGDRAILKEFIRGKAWGSECLLIQDLSNARCHLFTDLFVLVPVHYSQFEESLGYVKDLASRLKTKPGVIFYGNDCEHTECDRLSWTCSKNKIVFYWLGAKQRIWFSSFLTRGLDGIEWWNPENWEVDVDD